MEIQTEIDKLFKEMDEFKQTGLIKTNSHLLKRAYNLWVIAYRSTEPQREDFMRQLDKLDTPLTKLKEKLYNKYKSK